ncbi:MAG: hypothetical protein ACYDC1_24465, partial [Limisphaerales bacterium]
MRIKSIAAASALVALVGFSTSALAIPISGNLTFSGSVQLDTTSAGTATEVIAWSNTKVEARDGDFAPYMNQNDLVAFTAPWTFDSGPLPNFWSVGGFTFDLTSSAIEDQFTTASGKGFVSVVGSGVVSGYSFDSTPGTWSFTTQDPSAGTPATFSFSASTAVPDGG